VIHAYGLDESHAGLPPNRFWKNSVTAPALPLNIHHHVRPTTATDSVHGAK